MQKNSPTLTGNCCQICAASLPGGRHLCGRCTRSVAFDIKEFSRQRRQPAFSSFLGDKTDALTVWENLTQKHRKPKNP